MIYYVKNGPDPIVVMSSNDGVPSGFDMLHIGTATKSIFPNVGGGGMSVKIWYAKH